MLYNNQAPRGQPPLFYDHSNLILRVVVKDGFYCSGYAMDKSLVIIHALITCIWNEQVLFGNGIT